MTFSTEMKGEGERVLLPEGWHAVRVVDMELTKSKAGNEMFKVTIEEPETGAVEEVYCITTKGKRWMLKQLLSAVGIKPDEDGVFHWDIPDVIDESVEANVKHEPNEYINKEGETIKDMRNRISGFRKATKKATV